MSPMSTLSLPPDFTDPLAHLRRLHQQIRDQLQQLAQVADRLAASGGADLDRQQMSACYQFFSRDAQQHEADEREDIFPQLARQSLKLADQIHRLRQQHDALDHQWQAVALMLAKPSAIEDADQFRDQCREFADRYRQHLDAEEEGPLLLAEHIFSRAELQKIGRRMAERRGLRPPL